MMKSKNEGKCIISRKSMCAISKVDTSCLDVLRHAESEKPRSPAGNLFVMAL